MAVVCHRPSGHRTYSRYDAADVPRQGASFTEQAGGLATVGAPVGHPVYVASDSTVVAVGPTSGLGQWVKLAHTGGITTDYGHISGWTVTVGQAGDPLAFYAAHEVWP